MRSFHMPASQRSSWLSSLIADHRSRLASLWSQIIALGPVNLMKPHIFRRFLDLLAQIDGEKEQEGTYIDRIEAIEEQHRFYRTQRKLERANPVFQPAMYKNSYRKGLQPFFHVLGLRTQNQNHY